MTAILTLQPNRNPEPSQFTDIFIHRNFQREHYVFENNDARQEGTDNGSVPVRNNREDKIIYISLCLAYCTACNCSF